MGNMEIALVQNRLLQMGKTVCNLLEENGIPYMIAFGTLLGAVRHEGFIPWDDDFDLFLFDDSYGKAIEVLRDNLPDDMFLEDENSEPLYFHAWAHVKDVNTKTTCEQFPQDNIYAHKGLSVDLYCAHKMKEKEVDLFRLNENLKYQSRKYKQNLISKEDYICIKDELESKIHFEESKVRQDTNDADAYGMVVNERIMYPEEIFPLKKYTFEDGGFYGPNDSDSMLKRFYGDYMKLPAPEHRKPHYSSVEILE